MSTCYCHIFGGYDSDYSEKSTHNSGEEANSDTDINTGDDYMDVDLAS